MKGLIYADVPYPGQAKRNYGAVVSGVRDCGGDDDTEKGEDTMKNILGRKLEDWEKVALFQFISEGRGEPSWAKDNPEQVLCGLADWPTTRATAAYAAAVKRGLLQKTSKRANTKKTN